MSVVARNPPWKEDGSKPRVNPGNVPNCSMGSRHSGTNSLFLTASQMAISARTRLQGVRFVPFRQGITQGNSIRKRPV